MKKEVKKNIKKIEKEIKNRTVLAISAAFAFVIALSWNDAIRSSIEEILKILNIQTTGYVYKIIAAFIVTIIAVMGIMIASRQVEK